MADSRGNTPGALSHRPRNVEQITQAAQGYHYSAQIGSKYWFRSATALLREADIYQREGDDEQTYLLLFRHAHLVLANLAVHPDVTDKTAKEAFALAQKDVNQNLKKLDELKPRINKRYERYLEIEKEREARKAEARREKQSYDETESVYSRPAVQQLQAHENQELAVQLAQKEISRRAAFLERQERESTAPQSRPIAKDLHRQTKESNFNYPSVPSHRNADNLPADTSSRPASSSTYQYHRASPGVPPALAAKPFQSHSTAAPPRPSKISEVASKEPAYTFAPTAHLENGNLLRTLFLPPTLRTTFLRLAYKNTQANLETCGFLAGTLIANALFVSKLVIPAQISTSDTCEMTNESQLFDYIDAQPDLMILGWIHTHPTQSCFMSSRDLHTHSGYQMMLAESVAIVCAPSKGETSQGGDWGAYRLTDPPGKNTILQCQKPGLFHPHEVENIYTDALRPGHVVEARGLDFEIVDLRG